MAVGYVLYNEKAGNNNSLENIKKALEKVHVRGELKFTDICGVTDYHEFISTLKGEDSIILAGGDGTLNRFINNIEGIEFENDILYFPCGTGNDFAQDLGYKKECEPFSVKEYIKDLPRVTVKGKTCRFINGIGYGIDGYCCEVGDKLKRIPGKKVNYSSIAVKGLLFHYKPTNARVCVDGRTALYKKVWIAPTMNGRFYGGGMMPTPEQKRNSGKASVMIFHGSGKLKTLMIFPALFKGEHIRYKNNIDILCGKEISVEFDRPVSLQADGETVLDVSSYKVSV